MRRFHTCAMFFLSRAVPGPASDSQTHVLQGLATGVGFIGGGAILEANDRVHGTAAAASIWATAITGAAVTFQQSDIAVMLALVTLLALRAVTQLKDRHLLPRPGTAVPEGNGGSVEQVNLDRGGPDARPSMTAARYRNKDLLMQDRPRSRR